MLIALLASNGPTTFLTCTRTRCQRCITRNLLSCDRIHISVRRLILLNAKCSAVHKNLRGNSWRSVEFDHASFDGGEGIARDGAVLPSVAYSSSARIHQKHLRAIYEDLDPHGADELEIAGSGMDTSKMDSPTEVKERPKTSLELLNPKPWVPNTAKTERTDTEQMLELLSKGLVEVFCANDWSNPLLSYVNPQFQAYIDYSSTQVRSFQEHIDFHKAMHKRYPGYVYEVQSVSADVDEVKGLASTWTTLRVTGHPQRIQRESITVFWWRRKQGMWRVYKQFGVRGVGWFAEDYQEELPVGDGANTGHRLWPPQQTIMDDRVEALDAKDWLPDLWEMPE